jgi:hypothetical protein
MKKLLAMAALCLASAVPVAAQELPLVQVQDVTAYAGQVVDVSITVNAAVRGVAGADMVVETVGTIASGTGTLTPYTIPDPTAGTTAATPGSLWDMPVAQEQRTTAQGTNQLEYRLALAQSRSFDGPGTLVKIPIKIDEGVMSDMSFPLKLGKVVLYDINGNPISVMTKDGTINIKGGRYGDLNGDGLVTVGDVILAIRMAIGQLTPTDKQLHFADVTPVSAAGVRGDGKITLADVTILLQMALGIATTGGGGTGAGG